MDKNQAVNIILENFNLITLSKPTNSKFEKIRILPDNQSFFIEEFTKTQSFHKNLSKMELENFLQENIGINFKCCNATTPEANFQILTSKKGKTTVLMQKSKNTSKEIKGKTSSHKKNYILQEGNPINFLVELGVMTKEGNVHSKYYDKFRQINRFLEFIADILPILKDAHKTNKDLTNSGLANTNLTNSDFIEIIDFGCGKSYLTFAIYYYLREISGINCHITGIDLKADVIENCKNLAKKCGYKNLDFFLGDVADWSKKNKNKVSTSLVISLHACNTATDYALDFAVKSGAKAILSVPCCQHEINNVLSTKEGKDKADGSFQSLLKHGIIRERFSALTTDVLRAELLEAYGYKVQILEFIDMEHTPKNMLIRGVLKASPKTDSIPKFSQSYLELKNSLGICPTLETLLKQ